MKKYVVTPNRKTYYSGLIRTDDMNSGNSYRVTFSYGTFGISPKKLPNGIYYYAYKRAKGRLYKSYVGKCGDITHTHLHDATMKLSDQIYRDLGYLPN